MAKMNPGNRLNTLTSRTSQGARPSLMTQRHGITFIQGVAFCAAKVGTVDINSATQAELEAVKGIGPVTAKKIIDNRPYKSLSDLKKAGLSSKEITAFKPYLTAKPASAAAAPPSCENRRAQHH
jgi:competence protein ComEA